MARFEDYANKYQTIRMERRDGVLQLTFHTDGGSLQWGLLPHREFTQAFAEIGTDPDNTLIILTGTGADFSGPRSTPASRPQVNPRSWDPVYWEGKHLLGNLLDIEVPMISAINGPALRHSEIPLLCDIVLASETAEFQDSAHFPNGMVPGDGMHVVYPLLLGPNRGRYFLLTGQILSAQAGSGAGSGQRGGGAGRPAAPGLGAGRTAAAPTAAHPALQPGGADPGPQAAHARPARLWLGLRGAGAAGFRVAIARAAGLLRPDPPGC